MHSWTWRRGGGAAGDCRRATAACIWVFVAACGAQRTPPGAASLAASLGGRRTVEPRLSGGFAFSPCQPPAAAGERIPSVTCTPPGWQPAAARAAAAHLLDRLRRGAGADVAGGAARAGGGAATGDAYVPHLEAVARLALGGTDDTVERAVAELAAAADRQPAAPGRRAAELGSDLAAAYLIRAARRDQASDLVRALDAAESALAADPTLDEARFNRALALDRLGLRWQAAAAWEELAAAAGRGGAAGHGDDDAAWAGEAHRRLAELRRPRGREVWVRRRAALDAAALRGDLGDLAAVRRLVAASPQSAREYALEDLLGRWSRAWLAGRCGGGGEGWRALRIARAVGQALADLGDDGTAAGAVAAIDRAAASGGGVPCGQRAPDTVLADLAGGHRAYSAGMERAARLAVEEAAPLLAEARRRLGRAGSPLAGWAAVALAGMAAYGGRTAEARALFQEVAAQTARDRLPALCGRAHWGLGWLAGREGLLDRGLDDYREAAACYRAAAEPENLGAVEGLEGERLRLLGENALAWRERRLALARLVDDPSSLHLHSVLLEAARSAADEGYPRAALALAAEDEAVAERSGDPLNVAEVLLWRSKIELRLGLVEQARSELQQARLQAARAPAGLMRRRTQTDVDFAAADLLRRTAPAAALAPLSTAIGAYEADHLVWSLMPAYVSRARAELAAGRAPAAAVDVAAAVALFRLESRRSGARAPRRSFVEEARGMFDDMIAWQAARLAPPALGALGLVEEARSLDLPGAPAVPALSLDEVPPGVAILDYVVLPDRLLIWVLRRSGVQLVQRAVSAAALTREVWRFRDAMAKGSADAAGASSTEHIAETAGDAAAPGAFDVAARHLYAELIPETMGVPGNSEELAIVPDLALHQVPFAALVNPATGRFLVQDHALALAASVGAYTAAARASSRLRDPSRWSALLVGDPAFDPAAFPWLARLPRAAAEVAAIGALYPRAAVLLGRQATRGALLAAAAEHDVLHYAGHAVANAAEPGLSYLPLAPEAAGAPGAPRGEAALYAAQLEGRRLGRLSLVVLAACRTIEPREARAGLAGWVQPFLDAGAMAVLGTLWSVEDRAAATLLIDFHRHLRQEGDAARALREAQLALLASPDRALSAPAAWAGFALIGRLHHPSPC